MKLLTFEVNGKESWGFLVTMPDSNEQWVFNPASLGEKIKKSVLPTSSLWLSGSPFSRKWPDDMVSFLATEQKGMERLNHLNQYLLNALKGGSDMALLIEAGFPLSDVKIKAPVPRPRIYFGLVQNGPPFIRNNPARTNANLFPQGHNRTQGSVVGYDDTMVFRENSNIWGYNVELGIVIGKKGRYIPAHSALDYVAGYVPIMDACTDAYFNIVNGEHKGWETPAGTDWFQEATMSWGGKKADTMAPMGPYIVTRDEINNVYDLLSYSKKNGLVRDRTYTGCYFIGVERLIHWYSSFATLYPGDVLHLGTMGVDGLFGSVETEFGPEDNVEVEIEKLGSLRTKVVMEHINDWRDKNDPAKTIHPSPQIRKLIKENYDSIESTDDWELEKVRHYWTLYGNYKKVKECEGLEISSYPRMLNTPVSSLGTSGVEVDIPPRATTLDIGIELACVLKKVAFKVDSKDISNFILGYTPLISIYDRSFEDMIVEPATPQEGSLPRVYGRWADNFNVILDKPVNLSQTKTNRNMSIEIEGFGKADGSTSEYVLNIGQILEFITLYTTMFPGDVITLGRTAKRITVPAHTIINEGVIIRASIEDMPEVTLKVKKDVERKATAIKGDSKVI